jgi:hypothetical protein
MSFGISLFFSFLCLVTLFISGATFLQILIKAKVIKEIQSNINALIFGIILHLIIGIVISLLLKWNFNLLNGIRIFLLVTLLTIVFNFIKLYKNGKVNIEVKTFSLTLVLIVVSCFMANLPAKEPPSLWDGPYVFKDWNNSVRIQRIAFDLPPDNAIPFVVGEYLVNAISFSENRPIMPGQEVSNRPILMSLVAVPYRIIFGPSPSKILTVSKYSYVGTDWPETLKLVPNNIFNIYLGIGIALNSLIIFAIRLLYQGYEKLKNRKVNLEILAMVSLSPYFILHTFFTWPKNLAAFFIVTAFYYILHARVRSHINLYFAGLLLSLAYLSHPLSMPFIGIGILYGVYLFFKRRIRLDKLLLFAFIALSSILIWNYIFVYRLDLKSDIIQQSLFHQGSLGGQIWIRATNYFSIFFPKVFVLSTFDLETFLPSWMDTWISLLGPVIWLLFPYIILKSSRDKNFGLTSLILISSLLTSSIYSRQANPFPHGWQSAMLALIPFANYNILRLLGAKIYLISLFSILIFNSLFLATWTYFTLFR